MNITLSQAGMKPITISTESAADATGGGPVDAGTQQAVQQMQATNASNLRQLQDERNSLIQQMQQRIAQEQAEQEARRQQEEATRRAQEEAERAKTAANPLPPHPAPEPSAPQYDNNERSYYPDFNGNSAHDPDDYEDYEHNLNEYMNNTTPVDDVAGYIPKTDPNISKLNEDYDNLQNKADKIENTDAYRWQNPKDMAKMNDFQNDAIDFAADVHKTGLKYAPQSEIDNLKQSIRDEVDEASNELPPDKMSALRAAGQHIERKMLDADYARNENKDLVNEEYGRSLSDYYTNQAKEDRELGGSPTGSPRSAAGIPSNLKAGTANGSYQARTIVDENTGDINEIDPRNALNDVTGTGFAQAKKPQFMSDDELNFYEQKILNAPNQSETAKSYLSSIQQEKARRKQVVDDWRNELRMPSDARAAMNGEPRPTVDARPLTDPNANNNAKMIGKTAAGAGLIALAGIAAKFLTGTIFNKVTSIGKFTSGNQMLASPAFNQKLQLIARKFPGPYPTVQDVKASPNARNKDTFMGWLLGGNVASKHLDAASTGTLIKNTQLGIPVAITTISSTQSLQALSGAKLLLANAFVNKNGQLTSIPVARGFLAKGSMVNASLEAADIFFNARGQKFNKAQIKYLADKSYESFGPNPDFEAKIIDWYCL